MTKEQLEYILNSDIPNYQKSELIKNLYDREHKDVSIFEKGGETGKTLVAQMGLETRHGEAVPGNFNYGNNLLNKNI